jgi:hypothetical protein
MFKKSRITALKHRITRKKLETRRQLARQLIKGDVTVDQLGRLAGVASNGVLRTVNYLSETEGLTLAPNLSQAVAQVIAPASSSGSAILKRMAAVAPVAPKPAKAPAEAVAVAEAPTATETVAEAPVAEAEAAPVAPTKRTRAAAKTAEAPAAEVAETAPKKRTRAVAKTEDAPADAADAAPKKRTRAAAKPKE